MTAQSSRPSPDRALLMRRDVLTGVASGLTAGVATLGVLANWKTHSRIETPAKPIVQIRSEPPAAPLKVWPSLDALGQRMIDTRAAPGLSLSVMKAGVLLYANAFGQARLTPRHAVTPQTGFRIASISKQFTAAAILLLAEQGKLHLDDPLARFIPDFPRAPDMTLREMLSHTAGLDDYLSGRHADMLTAAQTRDYTQQGLLEALKAAAPIFRCPPGVKWVYSNTGFALLGIIVERLSGLPFGAFAQHHLFDPAGMTRTALDPVVTADDDLCDGHRASRFGFGIVRPVSPSFAGGSGGLRSTSEDLCRWHAALLAGKILKPDSLIAMLTPMKLKNDSYALDRDYPAYPGYGLGQRLGMIGGRPVFAHSGRINGFTGQLLTFPLQQVTMAVLFNCDGANSGNFMPSLRALRNEALALGLAA
ncbi:serine hydrolase domain-containing protein [Asticcacaulis sp. 201]|uniref:serine hydrolase domain-containing protein n=1 Tax=Asticcacaulis sp. 201 TaxID=3028787 RepID=UPI002916AA8A|nr:serine hydrolase domain-containing protein [Asticcacaulis sp. 201]MDV6331608.1 serine hydrolase domain-containing protein [Asticcacaulis sp. 201]